MAVTVDRRLFLSAEGELVEEGDPRAAFLWAGEGTEVDDDEAKRVGYKPATKEAKPAEDKQVKAPAEDKAAKPARARKATKRT